MSHLTSHAALCRRMKRFHDPNKNDGTENRDKQAIQVKSRNAGTTDIRHNGTANERPDDTDNNVHDRALFSVRMHDKRRDPSRECTEYDPENNTHT